MSAPVVFHQYLKDLYSHDIYIPLSFFTSPNLEYINSNASVLELSKTNTPYSSKDQIKLLNIAALEKACYKEEEMDRGQWLEASRNYVAFLGIIEGEDSVPQIRWDTHFANFEKLENAEVNFPAILAADVALRKSYVMQPFVFDIDTYRHMLDKCINSMHFDQLRSEFVGTSRFQAEVPRSPPNSRTCPPGSQDGGARGGDQAGAARAAVVEADGADAAVLPFKEAMGGPPPPPFASFAHSVGTASQNAHTICWPTDLRFTPQPETPTSSRALGRSSAGCGTSRDPDRPAPTETRASTPAVSVAPRPITAMPGPASRSPHEPPLDDADLFLLSCNLPRCSAVHQEIYSHITTPYDTDAIDLLLEKHDLTAKHPHLTENLRRGFPMGNFPILQQTTIFPNHPSCADHKQFIRTYLLEEVEAGRMSGPFSREETKTILKGPFQSSPIIISVQLQNPGEPDKLCLCRHLSKGNKHQWATNTYIDKEKFPTKYNTAAEVAEIVSRLFAPSLSHAHPFPIPTPMPTLDETKVTDLCSRHAQIDHADGSRNQSTQTVRAVRPTQTARTVRPRRRPAQTDHADGSSGTYAECRDPTYVLTAALPAP
jgi:hypothetical protein